ncbi:hypothetical protein CDV36_016634, partial [Fusarium kuroshium]
HFDTDSLPTPWKTTCVSRGRCKITRKERLVREEKYYIEFDGPLEVVDVIQRQMGEKGWDLGYQFRQSSNEATVVRCFVSIPSEFGLSLREILKDLKLAVGEDVMGKAGSV